MKVIARILVSVIALSAAGIKILLPTVNVDLNTTILIVIAALPWLTELIDTAELPGGWKFKFRSLKETVERAERIGLTSKSTSKVSERKYSFELIGLDDPNLALAGLRIEIEKRLRSIAEKNGVSTNMQGLGNLLNVLSRQGLIADQERAVIADLIGLLNAAVHGAKVDQRSANWAMDFGVKILGSLDDRTKKTGVKRTKR